MSGPRALRIVLVPQPVYFRFRSMDIPGKEKKTTDRSKTMPPPVCSPTKSSWSLGKNHSRNRKKRQSTTRMIQKIGPATAPSLRVL
jgi:hypothetical protein